MSGNEAMLMKKELNELRQEVNKLKSRITQLELKGTGTVDPAVSQRADEKKKGIDRIH